MAFSVFGRLFPFSSLFFFLKFAITFIYKKKDPKLDLFDKSDAQTARVHKRQRLMALGRVATSF